MKRGFFILLLLGLMVEHIFALDFGLLLNTNPYYETRETFSWDSSVTAWLSSPLSNNANLYLSGKFNFAYDKTGWQKPLFELDRSEVSIKPASNLSVNIGRQQFGDDAGMIASGLFDGVSESTTAFLPYIGQFRHTLGLYYTGFLYKKTSDILMTQYDISLYNNPITFSDNHIHNYFASRRVLASLSGEFPDIADKFSLSLLGLAQFDVNGAENDALHSQYLEVQTVYEAPFNINARAGEVTGWTETDDGDVRTCVAVTLGADWETFSPLQGLASLEIFWSTGAANSHVGAFAPISSLVKGRVFTPKMSALMTINAAYTAKILPVFSASGEFTYFIRTDVGTFEDSELALDSSSRALGGEFYLSAVWAPFSDIRATAGFGVFIPGMGGAFAPNAKARLKVNFGLAVSL